MAEEQAPSMATASHDGVELSSNAISQSEAEGAVGVPLPPTPPQEESGTPSEAAPAPGSPTSGDSKDPALPTSGPDDSRTVAGRIDALTKRFHTERIRRESGENELAVLRAELAALRAPESAQEDARPERPKLADYGEDTEAWVRADSDWAAQEAVARSGEARAARSAEAGQTTQDAQRVTEWDSQVATSRGVHADFQEVIDTAAASLGNTDISGVLATVQSVPLGAEVLYTLAQNPGEIARLAALSTHDQTYEIIGVSRRLQGVESPAAPVVRDVVEAPIPAVTPNGTPPPTPTFIDGEDHEAFRRFYESQTK